MAIQKPRGAQREAGGGFLLLLSLAPCLLLASSCLFLSPSCVVLVHSLVTKDHLHGGFLAHTQVSRDQVELLIIVLGVNFINSNIYSPIFVIGTKT